MDEQKNNQNARRKTIMAMLKNGDSIRDIILKVNENMADLPNMDRMPKPSLVKLTKTKTTGPVFDWANFKTKNK